MLPYQKLIDYLKQHKYPITIKPKYSVITVPGNNYHITIFQDQWDDYENTSGKPYYLFHVSSNNEIDRCSSYFWVDKNSLRIKRIPQKYFMYVQPTYSFHSSTRNPCHLGEIKNVLKKFQTILIPT